MEVVVSWQAVGYSTRGLDVRRVIWKRTTMRDVGVGN